MVFNNIKKVSETVLEIPTAYKEGMKVPARIYATVEMGAVDLLQRFGWDLGGVS